MGYLRHGKTWMPQVMELLLLTMLIHSELEDMIPSALAVISASLTIFIGHINEY